jgi:SAM-dependent methyltransferase
MKSTCDLRNIFDQSALDYEKARPGYPKELIQDIITISAMPENGLILEIGCGTGQATVPFAERGYSMICLDIGGELIARAVQNCISYPKVKFEVSSFENWDATQSTFDLVISATAFHWIPPEVGYPKVAYVLKDTGYSALFWNYHPGPYGGFFQAVQTIYQEIVPEWEPVSSIPSIDERILLTRLAIAKTNLYESVKVQQYHWERDYNTEAYLRLLNTYSDHRKLEDSRRLCLFGRIGELIEKQYGGVVTRPYLTVLFLAKKKPGYSRAMI